MRDRSDGLKLSPKVAVEVVRCKAKNQRRGRGGSPVLGKKEKNSMR